MFLHNMVEMGGFVLNHHWHGINVLSLLECCLLGTVLFTILALFSRTVRRSKRLRTATIASAMLMATAAYAANTALSNLSASGALAGGNLIYVVQTAGSGGVKATMTQVATFINSLFSGDFTCTSGGSCTVTKVNGQTPVASVAGSCGNGPSSPSTGAVVVNAQVTKRTNATTSDTILAADCGNVVYENDASAVAVTLPVATTSGFTSGAFFLVCNINAGVVTITPTTSTIGGLSAWVLGSGSAQFPACVQFQSDGTNYNIIGPGTFGPLIGVVTTQSGTTYTFANTDCGTEVTFSSNSAVTATIPATLPTGCNIVVAQLGTAKVSVNGSAVTPATLHSAHSYTGTSAQYAVIGINIEVAGTALLTGDGS